MPTYSGSYAAPRLDLGEAMLEYMYSRADFIGTRLLPIWRTSRKKASFPKITRDSLLRPATDVKRAPKAAYSRDDYEAKDQSYECVERGHEVPVDDSDREHYASDFDAERIAVQVGIWRVLYDQEIDIRDLLIDTTNLTTGNGKRTNVALTWADKSADVIGDCVDGVESISSRTGMDNNVVLAIGKGTYHNLLKNTGIRGALGTNRDKSIDEIARYMAPILGVREILVGGGIVNTAAEGQPFSASRIWSNSWAVLAQVAEADAPLRMPALGRTMLWVNDSPENVMVEEYVESQTRSNVFRARTHADELLIDNSYEQLLSI